ncbi:MAG TPA: tryptophan synthase subunit alpha [Desulfobacter sp.]|uniref:tryptophan synthase subunit alpha n=1 Tax=Desulfobacter sp. UBA2225 TaxID=1961413 RepID=UPI000E94D007|nr:tryptophan synthase subunit alpha [Desulfobacter sp. UBA2225]HAR33537.1 tryptophan synthase subunit alpha [Desulfobacter sp.]
MSDTTTSAPAPAFLETYIREQRKKKDILLMTHIVMGYPSFEASFEIVRQMVDAGVDLMELQIPFSEPMADGPVILKANQAALDRGATVEKCFAFAQKVSDSFDIPFLFMTYGNILFKYGMDAFASRMSEIGIKGAIVPDFPPEEAGDYLSAMNKYDLSPVFIFSPETSDQRMQMINTHATGFIYCLARKGVTGKETQFSSEMGSYLDRCRQFTRLPTAVGFGVKEKADVDFLVGKADIAVVGSQTIREVEQKGVDATGPFIRSLTE